MLAIQIVSDHQESVVANEHGGRKKEGIFVNIIDNLSVTFSSSGSILTSEINGTIQLKSYLTGNPDIRIALNELVSIGKYGGSTFEYGSSRIRAVILDDCSFHESVRADNFDVDRTLTLGSTDGEFPVMNYRITQEFKPPFRINVSIEESGPLEAEVTIKVDAEFSSSFAADKIIVQLPVPPYTTRYPAACGITSGLISFELEPGAVGNTNNFMEATKRIEWGLKKIVGGSEHTLHAKLTFAQEIHGNITKETGPVSMTFTIPNYNASRLQINYVYMSKSTSKSSNPYRWVRYVTQSNSYVARL